jgi:hypothetical protein
MIAAIRGPQQAVASTPSDARPLVRTASYSANGVTSRKSTSRAIQVALLFGGMPAGHDLHPPQGRKRHQIRDGSGSHHVASERYP